MFEDLIRKAKKEGSYDQGILEITGGAPKKDDDGKVYSVVHTDTEGNAAHHYQISIDKGVPWDTALELRREALSEAAEESTKKAGVEPTTKRSPKRLIGFYRTRNGYAGKIFIVLACERTDPAAHSYGAKLVNYF